MLTKTRVCIFACAIVFSCCICKAVFSTEKQSDVETAREAIDSLLQKGIKRVEVYYMKWNIMTPQAVSEQYLQDAWDFKTIVRSHNGDLSAIEEQLRDFKLKKANLPLLTFHLGVVFYDSDNKPLRLFFSKGVPVVTINGMQFLAETDLLMSIMPLLPEQPRREIHRGIMRTWEVMCSPERLKSKQSCEKGKNN